MKLQLHKLGIKAAVFACLSIAISTPKLDGIYSKAQTFVTQNHEVYTKAAESNVVRDHTSEKVISESLSELFDSLQIVIGSLPKLKEIQITLLRIINLSNIDNYKVNYILDWVIDLSNILNRITNNLSKVRNFNNISFDDNQEKIYRTLAKNSVSIISISQELKYIKKEQYQNDSNNHYEIVFSEREKLAISSLNDSLKG